MVFGFCKLESIKYLMLRYLTTGTVLFEDNSKDWLFEAEG
jgi:hypothetical protein